VALSSQWLDVMHRDCGKRDTFASSRLRVFARTILLSDESNREHAAISRVSNAMTG
jgi:hypothetical protein